MKSNIELGLVWDHKGHYLLWSWRRGWGRSVPRLTHLIIRLINPLCCRIWSHHYFPDFDDVRISTDGWVNEEDMKWDICGSCSKRRPHTKGAWDATR